MSGQNANICGALISPQIDGVIFENGLKFRKLDYSIKFPFELKSRRKKLKSFFMSFIFLEFCETINAISINNNISS